ncbi:MAG: PAS domain-containing protein [Magnetospirillum sp.]|nr:PAS domain-containing protein [Magnetospirillum sp.]
MLCAALTVATGFWEQAAVISSLNASISRAIATEANRRIIAERQHLTGREVSFDESQVIVSKTDTKGLITYANETFLDVSGFTEEELIGAPHSILRHPAMPRCVFKFLWDNIFAGEEVFAYVLNRAKNGDHYWVFAHVTPSRDHTGQITGFHSNRRVPQKTAIATIEPIYASLLEVERKAATPKEAVENGIAALVDFVTKTGMSYSELVFTL